MGDAAKSTTPLACCKTTSISNGCGFQRRLSPRLHSIVDVHNHNHNHNHNHIAEGCSVIRRFSPRLNNQTCHTHAMDSSLALEQAFIHKSHEPSPSQSNAPILIDLSPKSTSEEILIPEFCETPEQNSVKTILHSQSPKVLLGDPNFQRRLSPRLHGNSVAMTQKDACGESSSSLGMNPELSATSVNQIQRRVSPRLNHNLKTKAHKDSSMKSGMQRRLSPRLHSPQDKKQKAAANGSASAKRSLGVLHPRGSFENAKRSKHDHPKDEGCKTNIKHLHVNGTTSTANGEAPGELTNKSEVTEKVAQGDGDAARDVAGRSNHVRVKETLRIFNTYYLQFVQEQEERRKNTEIKKKKSKVSKSKEVDLKRTFNRPDLKAVSKMRDKNEILYPKKIIGHVPGVEVGHQFFSRCEMVAIGFHSHWLNGIDYIGNKIGKKGRYRHYTFPVAVAIVMSGQYEDDLDNSDDIVYTGQGGNDLVGSKLQCADQALVRGNLALKNNMEQSVPIRVIRGHKSVDSYSGKIYTYDGLYKVVYTWAEKGQRGHLVYKYRLQRLEGQPKLTTNQVQFVRGCPSETLSELRGLVCPDLSNGQEDNPIPVTNVYDNATVDPKEFTYIRNIEVAKGVKLPPSAAGCACKGNCTNPRTCACAKLNGSDFPYARRDGGRLVEAKDVVFECGPNCGCGPECLNRTSQRGIRYRLEVYRTPDKGWAVRSWDFIPSGAPICEYIGLLRRTDEVDNISGNDYIFEIDCWHTINEVEGRERRFGNVPVPATNVLPKIDEKTLDSTPEFCIDADSRGNVARFINHSCEPNLFVQCILSAHHDLRLARIVLFAADNISPMQELTYDYGYALDSVIGPDGKVKALPCFCGTDDCRKRLY